MIQYLFFDANITKTMESEWAVSLSPELESRPEAAFVATESGLVRIYPSR